MDANTRGTSSSFRQLAFQPPFTGTTKIIIFFALIKHMNIKMLSLLFFFFFLIICLFIYTLHLLTLLSKLNVSFHSLFMCWESFNRVSSFLFYSICNWIYSSHYFKSTSPSFSQFILEGFIFSNRIIYQYFLPNIVFYLFVVFINNMFYISKLQIV